MIGWGLAEDAIKGMIDDQVTQRRHDRCGCNSTQDLEDAGAIVRYAQHGSYVHVPALWNFYGSGCGVRTKVLTFTNIEGQRLEYPMLCPERLRVTTPKFERLEPCYSPYLVPILRVAGLTDSREVELSDELFLNCPSIMIRNYGHLIFYLRRFNRTNSFEFKLGQIARGLRG